MVAPVSDLLGDMLKSLIQFIGMTEFKKLRRTTTLTS